MNTLSYAISFWSGGNMKANFLRHEGYLGAIGAFLRDPPDYAKLHAFRENFSQLDESKGKLYAIGSLEHHPREFKPFPLLAEPSTYSPHTQILTDPDIQNYWIKLLDVNLKYLVDIATENSKDAEARASKFEAMYRSHLVELLQNPNAYGPLTIGG